VVLKEFNFFPSVVVTLRNQEQELEGWIGKISSTLSKIVREYELVIVDNASDDSSVNTLIKMTGPSGYPNLQVLALTKEVDMDTALWAGVDNAIGDLVVILDPSIDNIDFLPSMFQESLGGADVVFARNRGPQGFQHGLQTNKRCKFGEGSPSFSGFRKKSC
jgi:hypothetical protein